MSHGWVISSVFSGKTTQAEIENFLRYGITGKDAVREVLSPMVHEKVAKSLREGKVTFG